MDHILEKGSSPVNEDRLLMAAPLFGVFDGATSLGDPGQNPGFKTTGGAMAAAIARDTFSLNHFPLPQLAARANQAIGRQMQASRIDTGSPEQVWSTSAAVVRLNGHTMEWFRTGDAHVLVIDRDGGHKALGPLHDHDFPTLSMMKTQEDKSLANPLLRRQVLTVRKKMNQTYGVLNGDARAASFFNTGTLPLAGVSSILIFTDGLSLPAQPSPEPDFTPLVNEFLSSGLSGLHQKIRAMEKEDCLRKAFPRFKCHDDIAAIALHLDVVAGNEPPHTSQPAITAS